jgi:diadenosine tetraphosphate (Ap4A) HIT family hydrolase
MEASQCVFCSIISGLAKASIIYQDSFLIAVLLKKPISGATSVCGVGNLYV